MAGDAWDAVRGRQAGAYDAPRRPRPEDQGRRDRNGARLSQAADDLRGRLGLRAAGAGRSRAGRDAEGDADFWDDSRRRSDRNDAAANGTRGLRAPGAGRGWEGDSTQAGPDQPGSRAGYRGTRRAAGPAAALGGQGDRRAGLTAVRERTGLAERAGRGDRSEWGPESPPGRGRGGRGGGDGGRRGGKRRFNDDGTPMTAWQRFAHWLVYGSWWRHWTWKKAFAVVGGTMAGLMLLGVLTMVILYEMTPVPDATAEAANWQSSSVYFADHQLLGTFTQGGFSRVDLTESQIPTVMTDAMTAAEDRGFYTEGGISVTGLLRAAYHDLLGSGSLQGGSTITMQYAKNYYANVNTGQNISTKLKEIFIAMKLAHLKSKSWIMTQYLNVVPFGGQISGLGAAAEYYFNINLTKPGTTLTVPQAAMLAAIPNAPGYFNTDPKSGAPYTALVQRYQYVLTNMVRDGNITQAQATYADAHFPKITPPTNVNGWTGYKGYLMYMVEQELMAPRSQGGYGLTQQELDTGGYRITTTFDWRLVNDLAASVKAEQAQMKAEGVPFPAYDRIGSVLEQAKTGAIVAVYGGPGYPSDYSAKSQKWCAIWACQYNMAEAPEPVGSSFKPYVLSTAVSEGMNVFTSQLDGYSPIWIPLGPSGQMVPSRLSAPPTPNFQNLYWFKFNETFENLGRPIPVNVAAGVSSDPAFEDLAHRAGIDNVLNMAKMYGVGQNPFILPCAAAGSTTSAAQVYRLCNDLTGTNGLWPNFSYNARAQTAGSPAVALGESPLTAVEQATTFATLADDGLFHSPHVIQSITKGTTPLPTDVVTRQVLSPAAAANVDWALSFDNNMPGATAMGSVTFRPGGLIAKTGTLGSGVHTSQAWFVGATPSQYAMSVALFTNDPGTEVIDNLPSAGSQSGSVGGGWPATIWNNFFTKEFANSPTTTPFQSLEVNGYPFQKWVEVIPPKKKPLPICKPGQFRNCKQGCIPTFGQPCRGGNPSPSPSCHGFGHGHCGNPSPSPTPTCGPSGQPCPSPSPTPSPSCTPPIGQCGQTQRAGVAALGTTAGAKTAAATATAASGSLLAVVVSAVEPRLVALPSGMARVMTS